jgi:hypothetical protein
METPITRTQTAFRLSNELLKRLKSVKMFLPSMTQKMLHTFQRRRLLMSFLSIFPSK